MMELAKYLAARLNESGTWATIAALLAAAHVNIDPGLWKDIAFYGMLGAGALGVLIREQGTKPNAMIAMDVLQQLLPKSEPAAPSSSPGA